MVNYRSNLLDSEGSVLQKVEVQSSSQKNINYWIVEVKEFRIEIDYFHLLGPDHEQKCLNKFTLSLMSHKPALTFEIEGVLLKTDFYLSEHLKTQDVCIKNLFSEDEARKLFFEFHRECWKINDGILVQELMRVEEEVERNKVVVERMLRLRSHDEEVPPEILLTEDELWENRDFINLSS